MLRRPTITANVVDMLPDSGRRGFLAQLVALATGAKVAQAVAEPRVVAYDHTMMGWVSEGGYRAVPDYNTWTPEYSAVTVELDGTVMAVQDVHFSADEAHVFVTNVAAPVLPLPYGAGGAAYDPKLFRVGVWRPVPGVWAAS